MGHHSQQKSDIHYMKRALRLAKKGEGYVSPNPLVGAVIVKNNRIIGEGYHQKYGETHAEVNAINNSIQSVKNAILYCTLEPCCHTDKQTPPCVNRIIKEGIKQVVIASKDPNPKVSGKGIKLLQKAGIEVIHGILERENVELNKFYIASLENMLPFVSIKIAQSIDGFITKENNRQYWLTGEKAKQLVHQWRSRYDAVLIGANTVRVDNPQLSVRYGKKRNPLRIVLCNSTKINPDANIFAQKDNENTWILTTNENQVKLSKKLAKTGCRIVGLKPNSAHQLTIRSVLKYLYKQKITSVLVEGGQQIFSQFIQSGLWSELNLIIAPKILGRGIKGIDIQRNKKPPYLQLYKTKKLGEDIILTYLRK
jgi:diaminohydroxyphosphoribosylaminopyrimidine deaminase/5-amino-6-(5-phosphoribosylamino)uracil reductase